MVIDIHHGGLNGPYPGKLSPALPVPQQSAQQVFGRMRLWADIAPGPSTEKISDRTRSSSNRQAVTLPRSIWSSSFARKAAFLAASALAFAAFRSAAADSDETCQSFQCKVATRSKAKLPVIGA
jgi:hypothetical protein